MTRIRLSERTWWKIIAVLFAIMIFLNAFGDALGKVEGHFFPVKHDTTIYNIREQLDNRRVLFDGMATKDRDCELDHIEWFFRYEDGDDFRLDLIRRGRPARDEIGKYYFENWELYITPTELLESTYAYAYHRCHPFFKTVTLFFSGEKGNVMDTHVRDDQWLLQN